MPKIKKCVTESLGAKVLVRSTNQPQTAYAVVASLLEFGLKKILIDKVEANKSINRSGTQKNLYNALVESYNSNKDIITSYGDFVLLKKGRDDQDKDEDPSSRLDRGTKIRKSSKDAESSKDSRSKEKNSPINSKDASQYQYKSSDYLPKRKWNNLDKKRARVMVQDIDKQLYQKRLIRNLENFIGGRPYEEDLRLLERTI
uniref:Uncharacterized protein n=1 Tax=Tanacetum cinerariifolium TaxID=118510 RepID=A0A699IBK1_TANCI|nr:hypothetical protein [Tanacetum cinerariifolium]